MPDAAERRYREEVLSEVWYFDCQPESVHRRWKPGPGEQVLIAYRRKDTGRGGGRRAVAQHTSRHRHRHSLESVARRERRLWQVPYVLVYPGRYQYIPTVTSVELILSKNGTASIDMSQFIGGGNPFPYACFVIYRIL